MIHRNTRLEKTELESWSSQEDNDQLFLANCEHFKP